MIRPARPDDVPGLAALEAEALGADAWSAALIEEAVAGASVVVAEPLAGYAACARAGDDVELHRVVVAVEHRRRGVATALLDAALVAVGPAARVLLEVRADNALALGFYHHLGFTHLALRPAYYRDGTDALVMARHSGPTANRE